MDTFVAYQPILEDIILPQVDDVYEAILGLKRYQALSSRDFRS